MTRQRIADSAFENVIKGHQALEESLRTRRAIEDSIRGSTPHIEAEAARLMVREHARMEQLARAVAGDAFTAARVAMTRYAVSSTAALSALERAALGNSLRFAPGWLVQEDSASKALAKRIQLEASLSAVRAAQITGAVGDLKRFADPTADVARMVTQIEARALGALKPSLAMDRAWESVRQMAITADLTWAKFVDEPARLAAFSPNLARAPALEIYSAARASTLLAPIQHGTDLEEIEVVEVEIVRIEDRFETRLENFDPALLAMYRGASERIDQGGTDWQRQALISFRELAMHTLHMLAPDENVLPWARPDHFSNEKLTRQARVEFIFRHDNNGDLAPFMKKDFAAALELFELLNKVHKKEPAISHKQFRILKNRIQGLINTFLEAAGH